jgi:hypothetical protein
LQKDNLLDKHNKYAIPDIDAAKNGERIWFECKRKKMMLKYFATGYSRSNHICYKRVQEITGDKVFVIFEDDHKMEEVQEELEVMYQGAVLDLNTDGLTPRGQRMRAQLIRLRGGTMSKNRTLQETGKYTEPTKRLAVLCMHMCTDIVMDQGPSVEAAINNLRMIALQMEHELKRSKGIAVHTLDELIGMGVNYAIEKAADEAPQEPITQERIDNIMQRAKETT